MIDKADILTAPEIELAKETRQLLGDAFIFNRQSSGKYKESILQGVALLQKKMADIDRPFSGIFPHELAEKFENIDLDRPFIHLSAALEEIETLYLNDAIYFHHPKYAAHLNCPIAISATLAELILTAVNSSLDTWDQSAGGTFIEQKLIDWTAKKIGLPENAGGIFTSGGTQSNLQALLLARDHYCLNHLGWHIKQQGLPRDHHQLRFFTSQASHFSVQKAAAILGLGYESVIAIPCDRSFKMDTQVLEGELQKALAQHLKPVAVIATAGTTDFGSIDPLEEIAALCHNYNVWMHVDAAYGCGLLLSQERRSLLSGIQAADSVTVDYHKSFFQPVSCSALIVKDPHTFSCITHHADYLNPISQLQERIPNLVNQSIQTTKRFDALKLWLTLRTVGAQNLGRAFDQVIDLAKRTYELFRKEASIELPHQPELSILVFRYRPPAPYPEEALDDANTYIRKAIFRSGESVIAGTRVEGRQYLKFTLLNPATTIQDIQDILKRIQHYGQAYFNHLSNHKG